MLLARARLYAFPERRDAGGRLTVRDKLHLHEAGERVAAAGFQCVIGRDRNGICHDFIELRRPSEVSPAWTLVRSGPSVRAWRGAHGADLGAFPTLREAMDAVLAQVADEATGRRRAGAPGH